MKSLRTRAGLLALACFTAWLVCGLGPLGAQTNDEPQILFLHLKLKNKTISLVKSTQVPGVVKAPRTAPTGLQYEVVSATGESLWKGTIEDPGERHLEYEDPPGSGKLKRKTIHFDEAAFMVRVPLLPAAQRVEFYTLESSPADPK